MFISFCSSPISVRIQYFSRRMVLCLRDVGNFHCRPIGALIVMSVESTACCSRFSFCCHLVIASVAPVTMFAIVFRRLSLSCCAPEFDPSLQCWLLANATSFCCSMQYVLRCLGPSWSGHVWRTAVLGFRVFRFCHMMSASVVSRRCCLGHALRAERMSPKVSDAVA